MQGFFALRYASYPSTVLTLAGCISKCMFCGDAGGWRARREKVRLPSLPQAVILAVALFPLWVVSFNEQICKNANSYLELLLLLPLCPLVQGYSSFLLCQSLVASLLSFLALHFLFFIITIANSLHYIFICLKIQCLLIFWSGCHQNTTLQLNYCKLHKILSSHNLAYSQN